MTDDSATVTIALEGLHPLARVVDDVVRAVESRHQSLMLEFLKDRLPADQPQLVVEVRGIADEAEARMARARRDVAAIPLQIAAALTEGKPPTEAADPGSWARYLKPTGKVDG